MYECPYPAMCTGGNSTDDRCHTGATGPLCSLCRDKYFRDGDDCISCTDIGNSVMMQSFVIFADFAVVLFAHHEFSKWQHKQQAAHERLKAEAEKATAEKPKMFDGQEEAEFSIGVIHFNAQDVDKAKRELSRVKMCANVFVTTVQTMQLVLSNYSSSGGSSLPKVVQAWFNIFGFLSLDISSVIPGLEA